jgi:Fe-S-cluster containining protein
MVKASFSLPVRGGSLSASVELPAGQTTLTKLLPIIQNLENAVIGRIADQARAAGSPISCRAGCGACCRQLVPVSLFEAEALTAWIKTLPEGQRAELERRFHRAFDALRDAGLIERIIEGRKTEDEEREMQLTIDYFHAGVACPFLENESCSIHPIRPLACREYMVTSPAELCRDPSVNDVHGVEMPIKFSRVLVSLGQGVHPDDPRGSIPLVVLLAWAGSEAKPGERISGLGQEVLRQFLDRAAAVVKAEQA